MDSYPILLALATALTAGISRLPFIRFPMDEDFATWTYRARFAHNGLRWKQDMFCFYPTWRVHLIDFLHSGSVNGFMRVRGFLSLMHMIGSTILFLLAYDLTENPSAAFMASMTYALFASAPALSSESFNWEQIYVPFIIAGLYFYETDPDFISMSGLFFGLAVVAKVSTGIFLPGMIVLILLKKGLVSMITFTCSAVLPVMLSHMIEKVMGYLDEKSRRQFRLRLIVTLRCAKLKLLYGSISRDVLLIIEQTLPLWCFGLVGLTIVPQEMDAAVLWLYAATTIIMVLCQRGFSRYHYFPLLAVWTIFSALALDWILEGTWVFFGLISFVSASFWSLFRVGPFFLKPLETRQLSRYEKYDQFLYLPRLGKMLGRWYRLYGGKSDRLFVWGNYVQLYHIAGIPSSDQYVHYALGPWDDPLLADYFDTVVGGLVAHRPRLLVKAFQDFNLDLLREVTGLNYQLVKVVFGRFPVYRLESNRIPPKDPLTLPVEDKLRLMEKLTEGEHVPGISSLDVERGFLHKAMTELKKLTKLNPWDDQGLLAFAGLCERLGKIEESAVAFENLIGSFPKRPILRLRLAKLRLEGDFLEEAESLIFSECNHFGKTASFFFYRGLLARSQLNYDDAIEMFHAALEIRADWLECRLYLAEINRERGKISQARTGYRAIWDFALPGSWMRTQAALGLAQCDSWTRPLSDTLLMHYKTDPGNETLAYAMASQLEKEGKDSQAHRHFLKYSREFKLCHLQASAFFRLARLSLPEERIALLRKCLRLNPAHAGALKLLTREEVSSVRT